MPPSSETPFSGPLSEAEDEVMFSLQLAMQDPPSPNLVRAWLHQAKADGLDPEKLFRIAVANLPPDFPTPLAWDEVRPQ